MTHSKVRKFVSCAVLATITLFTIPTVAVAEDYNSKIAFQENAPVMPRLTYISMAGTDLVIENEIATVDCWVKGNVQNATKAKVIAELQLKSGNQWIAYGTWTSTQNDYEAYVYKTKAVTEGHTYRVKATYTVWEGSASEEIIVFSDEVTA